MTQPLDYAELARLLAQPVDLVHAIGMLDDGELAYLGEIAHTFSEARTENFADFGRQLGIAVAHEHARRAIFADHLDDELRGLQP